jgi:hypothetical protein
MQGAFFSAYLNKSLTFEAPTPTNIFTKKRIIVDFYFNEKIKKLLQLY